MFKSLRKNLKFDVTIRPFIKRTGTGTKEYGTTISAKCYPVGGMQVITNFAGAEVVSSKRLYLDGSTAIAELDSIILDGKEFEIKNLIPYYLGSKLDLWEVYL